MKATFQQPALAPLLPIVTPSSTASTGTVAGARGLEVDFCAGEVLIPGPSDSALDDHGNRGERGLGQVSG